jgi:hypothetical protein
MAGVACPTGAGQAFRAGFLAAARGPGVTAAARTGCAPVAAASKSVDAGPPCRPFLARRALTRSYGAHITRAPLSRARQLGAQP